MDFNTDGRSGNEHQQAIFAWKSGRNWRAALQLVPMVGHSVMRCSDPAITSGTFKEAVKPVSINQRITCCLFSSMRVTWLEDIASLTPLHYWFPVARLFWAMVLVYANAGMYNPKNGSVLAGGGACIEESLVCILVPKKNGRLVICRNLVILKTKSAGKRNI